MRPERLERPTYWFEASCSIQLSYGRRTSGERLAQEGPSLQMSGQGALFSEGGPMKCGFGGASMAR